MSPADRRAAIRRNHSKLSLTRQWQPLGHTSGSGDDDHSHDESEHTDGDHEHTEPDPDAGSDHAEGKRRPRYRGGRASTQVVGGGYGRSPEGRVLRGE